MIYHSSLEEFERAVYRREYEKASQLLLATLRRTRIGGEFTGYAQHPDLRRVLFTRFCAAVISLLADPGFNMSQQGFETLAGEHAILDVCFRHSAFGSSDHLMAQVTEQKPAEQGSEIRIESGSMLLKFLLTYSMRSSFSMHFEETFKRSPAATFGLWAGMLSALLTVNPQAQARREELLGLHTIFAQAPLPVHALQTLSDAYMYTSYALRRDKHDAKETIHKAIERFLRDSGLPLPRPADLAMRSMQHREQRAKPVILIPTEWFTSLHAMYRCYAPIIRDLREHFRLVGISRASDIDEAGKAEFDEWHEVSGENLQFADLLQTIERIAPDIVYYPSLGMAMWWVVLASIRVAPIQVMTLGHPASSRSPHMDYVICEEGSIGDPALFSERIVTMPKSSARFIMRPDAAMPQRRELENSPAVVHVAVPSMLCKLNARFMESVQRISARAAEAGQQVVFHFFLNQIGVTLHQAAREVREWIPTALIYERVHYNVYMEHLARCHLHLCTFPFGGTNSNIDSMLLGLPILTLEGDEPHERFDAVMARHAGLGERFVARSVDEYVDRAVDLITDHAQREAARDQLLATDLQGLFFNEPAPEVRGSFARAMRLIHEHHGALQRGPRVIDSTKETA
jgi:hypothetical protein